MGSAGSKNDQSSPSSTSWCPAQPYSFSLSPREHESQIQPFIHILVPSTPPFLFPVSSKAGSQSLQPALLEGGKGFHREDFLGSFIFCGVMALLKRSRAILMHHFCHSGASQQVPHSL